MPVISDAARNAKNEITYTAAFSSHGTNYHLHIKVGESIKLLSFAENDIKEEKNLFHEYNLNLKSFQL